MGKYTKSIAALPKNSAGEKQLELHHLDDNFTVQDQVIDNTLQTLFAGGGVAAPGTVSASGAEVRVQNRAGVTPERVPFVITDETTSGLASLAAGTKARVVVAPTFVTGNRSYTDVVTNQTITDSMNLNVGRLVVISGGTLDAGGYPLVPANSTPVARVTAGNPVVIDAVESPALALRIVTSGVNVREADGAPSGSFGTIIFPNGTLTDNGDGTVTFTPAGGASSQAPISVSFTANGDAYFVADKAYTLAVERKAGVGTVAYSKAAAATPTTFSAITLGATTTLAAGDVLKISLSAISGGYCSVTVSAS